MTKNKQIQRRHGGGGDINANDRSTWIRGVRIHIIVALLVSFIGITTTCLVPNIVDYILVKCMTLVERAPAYDAWKVSSYPTFLSIYLFHVVNPYDVEENEAKPLLQQRGPFVFREQEMKTNIINNPENYTKTYQIKKTWHFVPEKSNGSLTEMITTLNVPQLFAKASQEGKEDGIMNFFFESMLSAIDSQVFVNKTVGQLLFDGYEDELLAIASMVGAKDAADKFGWFYGKNGTSDSDGIFNMYTGADQSSKTGAIHTWNYANRTNYESTCGEIRGSAGGFYPPKSLAHTGGETLQLYAHDLCRTLTYRTSKRQENHHDLQGIVYELPTTTFANATVHPENWCFHNDLPTGLQNASYCKVKKSPFFYSFPHFYGADDYYIQQFDSGSGLTPNPENHSSSMLIEPVTTVPIKILLRLQINLKVANFKMNPEYLYFPAVWFEVNGAMDQESCDYLGLIIRLPQMMSIICVVSMSCTLLLVLIFAVRRTLSSMSTFSKVPTEDIEIK